MVVVHLLLLLRQIGDADGCKAFLEEPVRGLRGQHDYMGEAAFSGMRLQRAEQMFPTTTVLIILVNRDAGDLAKD